MSIRYDWNEDDDVLEDDDSFVDVDDILERWLAGEDVSDDPIWEEWDLKYADEEAADEDA